MSHSLYGYLGLVSKQKGNGMAQDTLSEFVEATATKFGIPGVAVGAWADALPATLRVTSWNGASFVPVRDPRIDWATASNQPTTIHFDPVRTSELRLEMTGPSPGSTTGFLQIAEFQARSE